MKKWFLQTVLIFVMTLISSNAAADKYSRQWKQVDKDIAQDLPESAADRVNGIFDMAARDHDSKQMLKSAVYMSQIESMMVGDNVTSSIELFEGLLPKLGQKEYKAICHAFIAKSYLKYWNRNRWRIQRNSPQDGLVLPLGQWTAAQICDTVMNHLALSVDMAGEARSEWFDDFFPGGNKEGMRLRPALTDLLLDNAVTEISGQKLGREKRALLDDARLYGTAQQFVEATDHIGWDDADLWSLAVLNRMTRRNYTSKPSARSTVDSRRMDVLAGMLDANCPDSRWSVADSLWVDGMAHLGESYGKKVNFASLLMSAAAERIMNRRYTMNDTQEAQYVAYARDLCNRAIRLWPKSEGAYNCMAVLSEIEAKDINLTLPGDLMAGGQNLAMFEYRNVGTVFFRAIEVAGQLKDMNAVGVLDQLARCSIASEWKNVVGNPGDYMEHAGLTRIPPLMQGSYYIVASTGPSFGTDDMISYAYCQCRALEFVPMETEKGNIDGYFINTSSGRPVPDVKYTLWQTDYRGNQTKVATYGFGDSDGHVLIQGLKEGTYSFELSHGNDMGGSMARVSYVRDMPQDGVVRFYTDRYSYRPGDSIQLAALFYCKEGFKGGSVKRGAPVMVELYDASRKKLSEASLVTDSMGMAQCSLEIPATSMPGSFRIRVRAGQTDNEVEMSRTVNVENFKQPKFRIEVDAFDSLRYFDSDIRVSGRVVTETGQPVQGAGVAWSARVDGGMVDIFRQRDSDGQVTLAGGKTVTGADGGFSLVLRVPLDITYADCNSMRVMLPIQVTDLNGETRSLETSLAVGPQIRHVVSKFNEDGLFPSQGDSIAVALADNDRYDVYVKGRVRAKVMQLKEKDGIVLDAASRLVPSSLSERKLKELSESALKEGLQAQFPRYCFDFAAPMPAAVPVCDKTVEVGRQPGYAKVWIPQSGLYRTVFESALTETYIHDAYQVLEGDSEWVPQGELLWAVRESGQVSAGGTAVVRLGNRWPGSVILYSVIDRMGMVKSGALKSDGKQMRLEIPVTGSMEGGFTVHLFSMLDNVTAVKDLYFAVPFMSHSLTGSVTGNTDVLSPGGNVDWKFHITHADGTPARARILLDMYDRSLDCIGTNSWYLQPWGTSYPTVGMWTTNRYSDQYNPAWYSTRSRKPYSGKMALTGVLLDPLQNTLGGTRSLRMMKSTVVLGEVALNDNGADMLMMDAASAAGGVAELASDDNTIIERETNATAYEPVSKDNLRQDMNPTGLFVSVDTGNDGIAAVSFQAPEMLAGWHVQAMAWTDSLSTCRLDFDCTTRRELMIEPASPRFVRQGDRLEYSFKIMNSTHADMDVKAGISLTDALSGKEVCLLEGGASRAARKLHVPAGGSAMAVFTLLVPSGGGLQALDCMLSATSGRYQDAVLETLPVLETRTAVTRSISLFNNGGETRSFSFDALDEPLSAKAANERVVVEYSSEPIWYAVQCLPGMIRADEPSSIGLVYSIMGAASAQEIMSRHAEIREKVSQWAAMPASALQSRLERNEDLTAVLAAETPWFSHSEDEKDRLRSLGQSLDAQAVSASLSTAAAKLLAMRCAGQGWPWMEGMAPNVHVTLSILDCLGRLSENGAFKFDHDMETAVTEALKWVDSQFAEYMDGNGKPEQIGALELEYLLVTKRLEGFAYAGRRNDVQKFYMDLACKQDTRDLSLMERACLALVLKDVDDNRAAHVVETMLQRSVLEDEMGRYWKDNKSGYRWQDAPIEAQSMAIEALLATGRDSEARECARWLLKQRQTSDWGTSPATAHAVVALLAAAGGNVVDPDADVTVSLGRNTYSAVDLGNADGYMKLEIPGRAAPGMSQIKVESRSQSVSWGAVYYQYTDELENVAESSTGGMSVERSMWKVGDTENGGSLVEIGAGASLGVGDRVRVRLKLSTDRAMEYVRLRDMWAAGFEPVRTHAGWYGGRFSGGGCYMAPGNSCTDFYYDRIEAGTIEIEYDMYVQKAGTFQAGRLTAMCLYSPDMNAGTAALKVNVR